MSLDTRPSTRILLAALLWLPLLAALPMLPPSLVPGAALHAQVRTVGAITGTVTDPDGNPVPVATVALRDERTNIARETASNEQGSFNFLDLQSGSYQVTVTLTGFQATVQEGRRRIRAHHRPVRPHERRPGLRSRRSGRRGAHARGDDGIRSRRP